MRLVYSTGLTATGSLASLCGSMDSMAVLLEAAAEDIKLIDCLGPEDLCYDPNSADGLKPVSSQPAATRNENQMHMLLA